MNRILVASGQNNIDEAVKRFHDYQVVGKVEYKNELIDKVEMLRPDILLVGEGLSGQESLIQIMLRLVKDYPNLRIIYLAGYVDVRDEVKVQSLGLLVMAGIYDIIHERKITIQTLKNILDHPKNEQQMNYLVKRVNQASKKEPSYIEFEIPEEVNEEEEDVYSNLYVVSSLKPGTGKTFLSTNIATAIAEYGVEKNGKKPKVALIEADLQNLSVGTFLQIEDDKKNLKSVIDKISTVMNEKGKLIGTLEEKEEVNKFILSCFKQYYKVKNLYALVGSNLKFEEIENIKPYHYIYLIDNIIKHFDVVIVDSNSALTHVTTYPILYMAKCCYYVINLDFNNIRNNVRYKDTLKEMGIIHKVKYVLNEDISQKVEGVHTGEDLEELIFTADHLDDSDFPLEARIPLLPKTVFLNRLYEGTPVVLDNKKYTFKAKYEILKVANQIWPIKNMEQLEQQVQMLDKKKKKGFFL